MFARRINAFGMTISGAGPSLFIAVKTRRTKEVAEKLAAEFPHYESLAIQPSIVGAEVK